MARRATRARWNRLLLGRALTLLVVVLVGVFAMRVFSPRLRVLAQPRGAGTPHPTGAPHPRSTPHPRSVVIIGLRWDRPSQVRTLPSSGDNWPSTWGSNGDLYTAYGDGGGFDGSRQLSLGFAVVGGDPFTGGMSGRDIKSSIAVVGGGKDGVKASGMLMVGGVLYVFVRNYRVNGDYRHSRLGSSADQGRTWTWANWLFSHTFGAPSFVQYGPGYAGGDRRYVYIVSQDNNDAYLRSPDVVLARVPRSKIAVRGAYQFFSGTNTRPRWSKDISRRTPIFHDANGVFRVAMSYNRGVHRFFLTSSHGDGGPTAETGALGVFDAPHPWGPWRTDYYASNWSPGVSYGQQFPPKYMSSDGMTMWLLFSGKGGTPYEFNLRRAVLIVASTASKGP